MDDVSFKVFVGSIDFNATEKDIEEAFQPYGEVVHVVLLRDKETQKSRGFGFVTFKEKYSVEAAIKGMNKQLLLGRPIVVNYAEKKSNTNSGGASGGANAASNIPNNFGSQQNFGYGFGQQQQGQQPQQQNPYFQGYQGQQGYGAWNQQGYGWGYWPQQGYGAWGQGWNQQMQQYGQQQQAQQGQQQQGQQSNNQGYSQNNQQGFPQNQGFNNSNYNNNTSQSGY